uniref:Uncharacterized protein n=1 Tax=Manihot esculenta TaxID=3983 RepID=A0A2C9UMK0_MANES
MRRKQSKKIRPLLQHLVRWLPLQAAATYVFPEVTELYCIWRQQFHGCIAAFLFHS